MKDSLRLGRIAGIPVGVNWSVVVMALAVVALLSAQILPSVYPGTPLLERIGAAIAGALLFFVSILGHEFGHALVARRHGVGTTGITLWVLGGVAKLTRQAPTPRAEFQIAIAGPAASLMFGLIFAGGAIGLNRWTDIVLPPAVAAWLAAVNLLLAVSNLLPGAPLDGGRVLTAALWKKLGDAEHARLLSARCGFVLGVLLGAVGLVQATWLGQMTGWWTVVVGLFILTAARAEILGAAVRRRLASVRANDLMTSHPTAISDTLTIDQAFGPVGVGGLLTSSPAAGQSAGNHTGLPVIRWDRSPIGYVAPSMTEGIGLAERSWTTVGQVMATAEHVPRAWKEDSIQTIIDRAGGDIDHVTVVHEASRGESVGTLSRSQIEPLLAAPDFWGRA